MNKQKTSQNADDLEQLAGRVSELASALKESRSAGTPSQAMQDRMDLLSRHAFPSYDCLKFAVLINGC
jgi:cytochrome c553